MEKTYYNPETGFYESGASMAFDQIPILVQAVLFASLVLFGFWLSRKGWNMKQSELGFVVFLLGCAILTGALILPIV